MECWCLYLNKWSSRRLKLYFNNTKSGFDHTSDSRVVWDSEILKILAFITGQGNSCIISLSLPRILFQSTNIGWIFLYASLQIEFLVHLVTNVNRLMIFRSRGKKPEATSWTQHIDKAICRTGRVFHTQCYQYIYNDHINIEHRK